MSLWLIKAGADECAGYATIRDERSGAIYQGFIDRELPSGFGVAFYPGHYALVATWRNGNPTCPYYHLAANSGDITIVIDANADQPKAYSAT
jgi:hypothetical protein